MRRNQHVKRFLRGPAIGHEEEAVMPKRDNHWLRSSPGVDRRVPVFINPATCHPNQPDIAGGKSAKNALHGRITKQSLAQAFHDSDTAPKDVSNIS